MAKMPKMQEQFAAGPSGHLLPPAGEGKDSPLPKETRSRPQSLAALSRLAHFVQEIAQQRVTMLSQDRLRMELHALDRQRLVAKSHDFVDAAIGVLRPGGDFEH